MQLIFDKQKIDKAYKYAIKEITKQVPQDIQGAISFESWSVAFFSGTFQFGQDTAENIICCKFTVPYTYRTNDNLQYSSFSCELTEEFFNLISSLESLNN